MSADESLEERAKKLLIHKLTGRGKVPGPFDNSERFMEEVKFLKEKCYIKAVGGTLDSVHYDITREGRIYAAS